MTSSGSSNIGTSSVPPSKLMVRGEVLRTLERLQESDRPTREERLAQLDHLRSLSHQAAVLDVLLKELGRSTSLKQAQVLGEVLMELAELEQVQTPLWELIKAPSVSDEIKDMANLILRHLGDTSDPELYLDYLQDPAGLISRETQRMLELAQDNPEALIDFLDFIEALPLEEQEQLLQALHRDYPAQYLVALDEALLLAKPANALQPALLTLMQQLPAGLVLPALHRIQHYLQAGLSNPEKPWQPAWHNALQRVEKLQKAMTRKTQKQFSALHVVPIGGVLTNPQQHDNVFELSAEGTSCCYALLPDGLGHQGFLLSHQWANGDFTMVCIGVQEQEGIMDAFGFYQLSQQEMEKLSQKFFQAQSHIVVSAAYVHTCLNQAEQQTARLGKGLPYEYTCWKQCLPAAEPEADLPDWPWAEQTAKVGLATLTGSLYQHPDFSTWFLHPEDAPDWLGFLPKALQGLFEEEASSLALSNSQRLHLLEELTENVSDCFLNQTEWLLKLAERLRHAAYLLHAQQAPTFAAMAATEALHWRHSTSATPSLTATPFLYCWSMKCVLEALNQVKPTSLVQHSQLQELITLLEKKLMEASAT